MNNISTNKKIRIIYIAGYGHSGSTILEILLCCSEKVIGLGELVGIPREKNASYTRQLFKNNQLCSNLFKRINNDLASISESLDAIEELNKHEHLIAKKNNHFQNRYNRFWSTFLKAAGNDPLNPINTFVDSSKTSIAHAYRPHLLEKIDDFEVTVIHIVRHPKPILWRLKKKAVKLSNKKDEWEWISELKQIFKTTFNWIFSNLWPLYLARKHKNYIRITFEQLCEHPVETLKKIEKECNLDLQKTIHKIQNNQPLPPTCGIAGNIEVRKKNEELRFISSKKILPKSGPLISLISIILFPIYKLLSD